MLVFLMLFPLGLLVALAWAAARAARRGRWRDALGAPLLILLALVACFVAGYIVISADPYFDDNGAPAFIEPEFRWVWALLFGGLFSVVVVPSVLLARQVWRAIRRRRTS